MTIKQHGGVFGRNPSFNDVSAESLTVAGNALPDASTLLVDSDIGTIASQDADSVNIDGGAIDGATLGGTSQVTIADADMNGGTIDGVTIGGASAAAGTFTTLSSDDGEVYAPGNILGTVSESSGTPTGAIIERGSNANGEYVKYADGTLICQGSLTFTQISTVCAEGTLTLPATSSVANSGIYPHFFAYDSRSGGGSARLYSDGDVHSFSRRYQTTLNFRVAAPGQSWSAGQTVFARYTVVTRWY